MSNRNIIGEHFSKHTLGDIPYNNINKNSSLMDESRNIIPSTLDCYSRLIGGWSNGTMKYLTGCD